MTNRMAQRFMRQPVVWKKLLTRDPYGGNIYGPARTINARWYDELVMIHTDDETETLSRSHISCVEVVEIGDTITDAQGREREVLTVRLNRDTRGRYSHRVAYLN